MVRFNVRLERDAQPAAAQTDALLSAVVRSAMDPIIVLDEQRYILFVNAAAEALLEGANVDLSGKRLDELLPAKQRSAFFEKIFAASQAASSIPVETRLLRQSESEISVNCSIWPMPASAASPAGTVILAKKARDPEVLGSPTVPAGSVAAYSHRNILVVEDETLIGLGLAAMLENAGFDVIGPASTVSMAMALLDERECALAILDINLGRGETSAPLAQRLKAQNIPFFVTSGYLGSAQPAIFEQARSFSKPVRARSLVAAVQEVLG